MFIVVLTKSSLVTRCYVRFMRHKVEQDDRFLPQKGEVVLKLGKDVSNLKHAVNRLFCSFLSLKNDDVRLFY